MAQPTSPPPRPCSAQANDTSPPSQRCVRPSRATRATSKPTSGSQPNAICSRSPASITPAPTTSTNANGYAPQPRRRRETGTQDARTAARSMITNTASRSRKSPPSSRPSRPSAGGDQPKRFLLRVDFCFRFLLSSRTRCGLIAHHSIRTNSILCDQAPVVGVPDRQSLPPVAQRSVLGASSMPNGGWHCQCPKREQ